MRVSRVSCTRSKKRHDEEGGECDAILRNERRKQSVCEDSFGDVFRSLSLSFFIFFALTSHVMNRCKEFMRRVKIPKIVSLQLIFPTFSWEQEDEKKGEEDQHKWCSQRWDTFLPLTSIRKDTFLIFMQENTWADQMHQTQTENMRWSWRHATQDNKEADSIEKRQT